MEHLRQEFIANVSHDLRTPLTMITGYAEVMRDLPGENTPENVQIIIDEARRLTDLVNDLLNLSLATKRRETPEPEPVNSPRDPRHYGAVQPSWCCMTATPSRWKRTATPW